jgi:hypothetical protein
MKESVRPSEDQLESTIGDLLQLRNVTNSSQMMRYGQSLPTQVIV